VFAQQSDIFSLVVLQVAFDVASLPAFEMIFEHFDRLTRSHYPDAQAMACVAVSFRRQKSDDAMLPQPMVAP
jgi:hypothetical protein